MTDNVEWDTLRYHHCKVCGKEGIPEYGHRMGQPFPPKVLTCIHCESTYREGKRWKFFTFLMPVSNSERHFYGISTLGLGYMLSALGSLFIWCLRFLFTFNKRYILLERGPSTDD